MRFLRLAVVTAAAFGVLNGCNKCSGEKPSASEPPEVTAATKPVAAEPPATPPPATAPAPEPTATPQPAAEPTSATTPPQETAATPAPTTGVATATTTTTATATSAAAPKAHKFESKDIKVGSGAVAADGKTVTIHYVGTFEDGAKFDSSVDREAPLTFQLGKGEQIKGWDQGVKGMKVGGKRQLVVPPQLGYGEKGVKGVIPPNATLFFEVELLNVQ